MNIFINGFEEPDVAFPDKLVLEKISGFSKAAQGLAQLKLLELDLGQKMQSDLENHFQFIVMLTSDYLRGYSFKVFEFGYDITIYPVSINFGDAMGEDLKIQADYDDSYIRDYATEEDFGECLNTIFSSKYFRETVGGLMKIAKSKMKNT